MFSSVFVQDCVDVGSTEYVPVQPTTPHCHCTLLVTLPVSMCLCKPPHPIVIVHYTYPTCATFVHVQLQYYNYNKVSIAGDIFSSELFLPAMHTTFLHFATGL